MNNTQRLHNGFTLIEMMIVVALLALVASIALPTYNKYVRDARLTECSNEVNLIRLAEEEFFLENNTYFQAVGVNALEAASQGLYNSSYATPADLAAANCTYRVDPGSTGAIASSYSVTATGQNHLDASETFSMGN